MSDVKRLAFWPVNLERSAAPEAAGPNAARVLENVEADAAGRLRRRRGMAAVDALRYSDNQTSDITSAIAITRRDGTVLLFDGDAAGVVRVRAVPALVWTDLDAFGASGTDGFNLEFNEEGN